MTLCCLLYRNSAEEWLHLFINYCYSSRSIWNSICSKFVLQSGVFGSIEEEPHDFLSCNDQSKEDNQIYPCQAMLPCNCLDRINGKMDATGTSVAPRDLTNLFCSMSIPSPVRSRAIHFRPASCRMEPSQPCSL